MTDSKIIEEKKEYTVDCLACGSIDKNAEHEADTKEHQGKVDPKFYHDFMISGRIMFRCSTTKEANEKLHEIIDLFTIEKAPNFQVLPDTSVNVQKALKDAIVKPNSGIILPNGIMDPKKLKN